MSAFLYRIATWLSEAQSSAWKWLYQLDRQEWLMVLLVTMVLGFLCMRGYGSRDEY